MSKKRDTSNDSKSKKRCKSKNIDDKKWEHPAGYYKEYETRMGRDYLPHDRGCADQDA